MAGIVAEERMKWILPDQIWMFWTREMLGNWVRFNFQDHKSDNQFSQKTILYNYLVNKTLDKSTFY